MLFVLCQIVLSNISMLGPLCLDVATQRNCCVFGMLTVHGDVLSMITSLRQDGNLTSSSCTGFYMNENKVS